MEIMFFGAGSVATAAYNQVIEKGGKVSAVVKKDGIYDPRGFDPGMGETLSNYLKGRNDSKIGDTKNYLDYLKDKDAVFLMIPTADDGSTAYGIIDELNSFGFPVVTCEKGALSYNYKGLEKNIESGKLGFNASAGGGTLMLDFLRKNAVSGDVDEIHFVNNASLNYIVEESGKVSFDNAIKKAISMRIVEPGSVSPLEIINAEANGDVPRKTTIIFNDFMRAIGERKNYISHRDIEPESINERMLKRIARKADTKKFIVSIEKNGEENLNETIGGFELVKGDWLIKAGFRDKRENSLFKRVWPSAENNAMVASLGKYGSKGVYSIEGDGAKPEPTARSIIYDTCRMIENGIIRI